MCFSALAAVRPGNEAFQLEREDEAYDSRMSGFSGGLRNLAEQRNAVRARGA